MTASDSGVIFLVDAGQLQEMREVPYQAEAVLQDLIATHPRILAGEQVDVAVPRRWVLVAQEAGLPGALDATDRWSIDHLLLDQDGIPTIVEVKRSSDTRIRREVVGQILDYAANAVVYWPGERLRGWFEEQHGGPGDQADSFLIDTLGLERDLEDYWALVKENLATGRLRLVFLADVIPPELRRIVEYLDEQLSRTRVIAIEVRRYAVDDTPGSRAALVPRVVGMSSRKPPTGHGEPAKHQWDETSILEAVSQRRGAEEAGVVSSLIAWSKARGLRQWYGSGARSGSFYPMVDLPDGTQRWLFSVWTEGQLRLELGYLMKAPAFTTVERRLKLLAELNTIAGIAIPMDRVSAWPSFRLATLVNSDSLERFRKLVDEVVDELRQPPPVRQDGATASSVADQTSDT